MRCALEWPVSPIEALNDCTKQPQKFMSIYFLYYLLQGQWKLEDDGSFQFFPQTI